MKIDNKRLTIIFGFILILIGFYWFQVRPARIRPECVKTAEANAKDKLIKLVQSPGIKGIDIENNSDYFLKSDYEYYYKRCLNEHGIK